MIEVVVGGPHALFVDLLCSALAERGFAVVARAAGPDDLVAAVRRHRPRLCLVDASSDTAASAGLIRRLADSGVTVIVVLASADEQAAHAAIEAGARGCLHRTQSVDELALALRHVADSEEGIALPPPAVYRADLPDTGRAARRLADSLTARERQCLEMFVDGVPTAQIVAELGISVTTVRSHVQSVLHKLGASSRVEAASLAVRHGLVAEAPAS